MLPPEYLGRLPDSFLRLVYQAEEDILEDMARRIAKTGRLTDTARWQGERLEQLGLERETVRVQLQRLTGKSQGEINALFEDAGEAALYYDDLIYQAIGLSPIAANASPALVQLLNAGARQTNRTFENLTATTANTATRQFERALDRAWTQIATGAFDYQTAIRRAIKELAEAGLQAIIYPSGHVDTLEVAARRAILTGVNQTAARLSEARAEEMGCDLVETTAHHGARPSHMVWQGQVFSRSGTHPTYPDFEESTGYGTGAGLCGWNCRHSFFPFFEELSKSAYPREALQEYERDTVTYNCKKMSVYDATQRQRYIERRIRRWKREYLMMDAAGQSTAQASAKLAQWRAAEKDFCRQTGLDRDGFRSQVHGFGHSQASKTVWSARKGQERENYLKTIKPTLPKTARAEDTTLQEAVEVTTKMINGILPRGAALRDVRIIAGYGTSTELRVAKNLTEKYGGDDWKWMKKGGIIETDYFRYDVHWYEYDGKQFDGKGKGVKKR